MDAPIGCAGAPRDVGLDQGRACRQALRARFAALPLSWRLAWRAGRAAPPPERELRRHFPHQAECLAGLAAGAGVPRAWLVAELATAAAPVVVAAAAGAPARVGCRVEGAAVVRRSRPEGLFASIECTRPWLSAALAGVNEAGLAVALAGPAPAAAALLAQDCLERFARLDAALEWCAGRPGTGDALLLLADAEGEVGGVELCGAGRRVLRPADGRLAAGAPAEAADFAKAMERGGAVAEPGVVLLDPGTRRLAAGGAWIGLAG